MSNFLRIGPHLYEDQRYRLEPKKEERQRNRAVACCLTVEELRSRRDVAMARYHRLGGWTSGGLSAYAEAMDLAAELEGRRGG